MKKSEQDVYLKKLLGLRARLTGEMQHLTDEALAAGATVQSDQLAEVGSDAYEQDITLQMVQSERNILFEIDEAIKRCENGIYGVCEMSGKPIPKARLNAIPWTRYRVECARIAEQS